MDTISFTLPFLLSLNCLTIQAIRLLPTTVELTFVATIVHTVFWRRFMYPYQDAIDCTCAALETGP